METEHQQQQKQQQKQKNHHNSHLLLFFTTRSFPASSSPPFVRSFVTSFLPGLQLFTATALALGIEFAVSILHLATLCFMVIKHHNNYHHLHLHLELHRMSLFVRCYHKARFLCVATHSMEIVNFVPFLRRPKTSWLLLVPFDLRSSSFQQTLLLAFLQKRIETTTLLFRANQFAVSDSLRYPMP